MESQEQYQQQLDAQQSQDQQLNQQQNNKKNRKTILLLVLLLVLVSITIGYAVLSTSLNIIGTTKIVGEWCVGVKCGACNNVATCQNSPISCPNSDCVITDCDANSAACNCNANTGECSGPTAFDCSQDPDKSDSSKCTCDANNVCVPKAQVWLIGDSIYFRNTLTKPGDVFTFDTTYTNGGNIDAKLGSFTKSALNETAQDFLTYEVKYSNGSSIITEEALNVGATKTFRVTVSYKNVDTLPTQAQLALINENGEGATSTFTANYVQKQ